MKEETENLAVRNYKDTVFRMLFREKDKLLSLFNAINDTHYENPNDLEVNTLENAVYMSVKNDLSCVLDMRMNLYEHQSTVNPNMPLRDLFYVARLYEKITTEEDIYSSKQIMIPTPRFVVLYNGEKNQPERKILRLSDSYVKDIGEINLELKVLQLNINIGYNKELSDNCKTLYEYMQYTDRVRMYRKTMDFTQAVEQAVSDCIKEGILEEFLCKNRAEVVSMSIFEYNKELHEKSLIDEGMERGMESGLSQGEENERVKIIKNMLKNDQSPEFISSMVSQPLEYIYQIQESMRPVVCEENKYVVEEKNIDKTDS